MPIYRPAPVSKILFIVTLLLLVKLSVLYTFTLVGVQWLQKVTFCSMFKLMPLFDDCNGPYKYKHRYWTGLLLLVRVVVLTIFSLNFGNDPAINLLTIFTITFILTAYASYANVYKDRLCSLIEVSFFLNLGLLS